MHMRTYDVCALNLGLVEKFVVAMASVCVAEPSGEEESWSAEAARSSKYANNSASLFGRLRIFNSLH